MKNIRFLLSSISGIVVTLILLVACSDNELNDRGTDTHLYKKAKCVIKIDKDATATRAVDIETPAELECSAEGLTDAHVGEYTMAGIYENKKKVVKNEHRPSVRGVETTMANFDYAFLTTCVQHKQQGDEISYQNRSTDKVQGEVGKVEVLMPNGKESVADYYFVSPAKWIIFSDGALSRPSVAFEVKEKNLEQEDLLIARNLNHKTADENMSIRFNPILTAVRIGIGSNLNWGAWIKKVELRNVYGKGTYDINKGVWTVDETKKINSSVEWGYHKGPKTDGKPGELLVHDELTFLMLPQTLPEDARLVVTLQGVWGKKIEINAKIGGREWRTGTTKTYLVSNKKSNWKYHFNVTQPSEKISWLGKNSEYFKVESSRHVDNETQNVPWTFEGYADENGNVIAKPNWVKKVNLVGQEGGLHNSQTNYVKVIPSTEGDVSLQKNEIKGSAGNRWNLAEHDAYGKALGGESTANCYVINSGGHYKLPLVYGNALKNGQDNRSAYTFGGSSARVNVLKTFVDSKNQAITQPWISGARSAEVLWCTDDRMKPGIKVNVEGKYMNIDIAKDKIVPGNAVVLVKDEAGKVLWSWLLWFADPNEMLKKHKVKDWEGNEKWIAAQNLGATYNVNEHTTYEEPRTVKLILKQKGSNKVAYVTITQADKAREYKYYETKYQWGRKDPFTDNDGNAQLTASTEKGRNKGSSIGYGISHPLVFMQSINKGASSRVCNWCDTYYKNLWNADEWDTNYSKHEIVKTIYDPCPYGFSIPKANLFKTFAEANQKAAGYVSRQAGKDSYKGERGVWFKLNDGGTEFFMPYSGYRHESEGTLDGIYDNKGYYWLSTIFKDASNTGCATRFYFDEKQVQDNKNWRVSTAYGMPIRPMVNE